MDETTRAMLRAMRDNDGLDDLRCELDTRRAWVAAGCPDADKPTTYAQLLTEDTAPAEPPAGTTRTCWVTVDLPLPVVEREAVEVAGEVTRGE